MLHINYYNKLRVVGQMSSLPSQNGSEDILRHLIRIRRNWKEDVFNPEVVFVRSNEKWLATVTS